MKLSLITAACAVLVGLSGAGTAAARPADLTHVTAGPTNSSPPLPNAHVGSDRITVAPLATLAPAAPASPLARWMANFGDTTSYDKASHAQTPWVALQTTLVLSGSNAPTRTAQGIGPVNRDSASLEPDVLMMLLTGLGVMGSIVRRRHLAKKSA